MRKNTFSRHSNVQILAQLDEKQPALCSKCFERGGGGALDIIDQRYFGKANGALDVWEALPLITDRLGARRFQVSKNCLI